MLYRKFARRLEEFLNNEPRKILLVNGARQIGKSYIIRYVGKQLFKNFVEINLKADKEGMGIFQSVRSVDDFYLQLGAIAGDKLGNKQDTIVFLDEIQSYPHLMTMLKFLNEEGKYRYIASGSELGVALAQTPSVPIGSIAIEQMYPLDFEEFLWANGITEPVIDKVKECFENEMPVPDALHLRFRQLILQYTVVGGMPAAVNLFLQYHDLGKVLEEQRNIIAGYEDDMVKYADEADKSRIRECFESIPLQLSKENKKFQYAVVRKNSKASQYQGSLQWIEDAGIITRCRNLNITELPLDGNAMQDAFKVYMVDTGLFVSMLEDGTQFDILQGNLYGYKGAIFENLIADIFTKMKRKLYYFRKDSGLEVDFVIRYKGECVLVEVKAKDGNTKSTKTILANPDKYHVFHAIKLGDYNVGRSNQLLTIPLYMAFLLRQP